MEKVFKSIISLVIAVVLFPGIIKLSYSDSNLWDEYKDVHEVSEAIDGYELQKNKADHYIQYAKYRYEMGEDDLSVKRAVYVATTSYNKSEKLNELINKPSDASSDALEILLESEDYDELTKNSIISYNNLVKLMNLNGVTSVEQIPLGDLMRENLFGYAYDYLLMQGIEIPEKWKESYRDESNEDLYVNDPDDIVVLPFEQP